MLNDDDEITIYFKHDVERKMASIMVETEISMDSNDFLTTIQSFITNAIEQNIDVFNDSFDLSSDIQ